MFYITRKLRLGDFASDASVDTFGRRLLNRWTPLMLRWSMLVLVFTRGRLAHLASALMARTLVAARGSHPLTAAASLANAVVRADGTVRETLALVRAGVASARHRHVGAVHGSVEAVTRHAGDSDQR